MILKKTSPWMLLSCPWKGRSDISITTYNGWEGRKIGLLIPYCDPSFCFCKWLQWVRYSCKRLPNDSSLTTLSHWRLICFNNHISLFFHHHTGSSFLLVYVGFGSSTFLCHWLWFPWVSIVKQWLMTLP